MKQEGKEQIENDENQYRNQANCSSCMKVIANPISEGQGIVCGHVKKIAKRITLFAKRITSLQNGSLVCETDHVCLPVVSI